MSYQRAMTAGFNTNSDPFDRNFDHYWNQSIRPDGSSSSSISRQRSYSRHRPKHNSYRRTYSNSHSSSLGCPPPVTSPHSSPISILALGAAPPMTITSLNALCEARVFTPSTGVVLRQCYDCDFLFIFLLTYAFFFENVYFWLNMWYIFFVYTIYVYFIWVMLWLIIDSLWLTFGLSLSSLWLALSGDSYFTMTRISLWLIC